MSDSSASELLPQAVLDFWFGPPDSPEFGQQRSQWFRKAPDFDREIRDRFEPLYRRGAAGELDDWQTAPESCLALLLLLDQFPRNLYRGRPQAFATDDRARAAADRALSAGFDRRLLPVQRWFVYLPFEHSENWADQARSLELFATLKDDPASASAIDYARRHAEVIARFGRFPHRNAILGRESTPEEREFLQQPGSSF